jgi:DNA-binding GntR family transcriptional regulator
MHDFIIRASENDLLAKIHKSLKTQELRFSVAAQTRIGNLLEVFREHMAIGEALLKRDEDRVALLMTTHIENARLRALAMLHQNEDRAVISDIGSSDAQE